MQIPVIHFTTLADLLAELTTEFRHVIRVAISQRTESRNGNFPTTVVNIAVDVRTLHYDTILSYRAMQEEIRRDLTSDRAEINRRYNQAWNDANIVRTAVCAAIYDAGHDARPGIIDLGNVQPITGEQWPLSETDHAL